MLISHTLLESLLKTFCLRPCAAKESLQPSVHSDDLFRKYTFFNSQLSMKLLKFKMLKKRNFLALIISNDVFIQLINVKMATIVGILTFMSRLSKFHTQLSYT